MRINQITKPVRSFFYYFFLIALTLGASLTLGLLSFSGMFVIWPIVGLAAASFILAILYEGEIFWQNLAALFKNFFKFNFLTRQLAREFISDYINKLGQTDDEKEELSLTRKLTLAEEAEFKKEQKEARKSFFDKHLVEVKNTQLSKEQRKIASENFKKIQDSKREKDKALALFNKQLFLLKKYHGVPPILLDYLKLTAELNHIDHFKHHYKMTLEDQLYLKNLKKQIAQLELEFGEQLIQLKTRQGDSGFPQWAASKVKNKHTVRNVFYLRHSLFALGALVSICAGAAVFVGTSYLLFDAFLTVSVFAFIPATALPAVILTLAAVSGVAYMFITYYSINSMINNRTLQNFFLKFKKDLKEGSLFSNFLRILGAIIILGLTLAFTICTAGTWWTIGQNLSFLISKVYLKLGAFFAGLQALFVNLFNALCTWDEVRGGFNKLTRYLQNVIQSPKAFKEATQNFFKMASSYLKAHFLVKNWNIPRLLLNIIFLPIDIALFICHIVSIAVTGDQIQGIPWALSLTTGALQEFFEDFHRFYGHGHCHSHDTSVIELLDARSKPGSGHEHGLNLPRKIIQIVLSPLYFLATLWDWITIKKAHPEYTLGQAFKEAAKNQLSEIFSFFKEEKPLTAAEKSLNLNVDTHKHLIVQQMTRLQMRLQGKGTQNPVIATQKISALEMGKQRVSTARTHHDLSSRLEEHLVKYRPLFGQKRTRLNPTTEEATTLRKMDEMEHHFLTQYS